MDAIEPSPIYMAIDMASNGEFGCCCFDDSSKELQILPGAAAAAKGLFNISRVVRCVRPTLIVLSINAEERLKGAIEQDPQTETNDIHNLHHLQTYENKLSAACASALASFILNRRCQQSLDVDLPPQIRISRLGTLQIPHNVHVPLESLIALQIVPLDNETSHHAEPFLLPAKSRRSRSLLGMFEQFAQSPQGRRKIRRIIVEPSQNIDEITERLDLIEALLKAENAQYKHDLIEVLRNIKDINTAYNHISTGGHTFAKIFKIQQSTWAVLRSFAYHCLHIRLLVCQLRDLGPQPLVAKILERMNPEALAEVGFIISQYIDFAASADRQRTVINIGVDPDLDKIKELYGGIEDLLTRISMQIKGNLQIELGTALHVVFLPQVGFLISVPISSFEHSRPPWPHIFSNATNSFFKDERMEQIDAEYGDIYTQICDREVELVCFLSDKLLNIEHQLHAASDACGDLDSLLAFASAAEAFDLRKPVLVEDQVIAIQDGRHALHAGNGETFIPNDSFLGVATPPSNTGLAMRVIAAQRGGAARSGKQVLLMAGPNFSGKSMYIKQVALIIYMAHLGSFVPARNAVVGIIDAICTKFAIGDTVVRQQSAFAADVKQIAKALASYTARSLLLIDEFGKGTNVENGVGLLCGIMKYALTHGSFTPQILVATHLFEIFESAYLRPHPAVLPTYMAVDSRIDRRCSSRQLAYLYTICPGVQCNSYGIELAEYCGINAITIARAKSVRAKLGLGSNVVSYCLSFLQSELCALGAAEHICRDLLTQQIGPIAL